MITSDIVVVPRDNREILPEKFDYLPAVLWLFNDTITIYNSRTDEYQDIVISDSTSNSLLPAPNQCDNHVISRYFTTFTDLCHNGSNIRIYSLGVVNAKNIIDTITNYLSDIYPDDYTFMQPASMKYNNNFDTYVSTLFLLTSHAADVYACHVSHFEQAPDKVIDYVLDQATRTKCNVFIDTGISNNRNVFTQVYNACLNFGHDSSGWRTPIFIVLNLPLIPSSMVHPYSIPNQGVGGRYNVMVFHGHAQLRGRVVTGYIPASVFYGTILSEKARVDYYSSIVDRINFVAKGTNVNIRKNQYLHFYDINKINTPYIEDGFLYLSFPRTTETRDDFKILKHENNARLAIDLAINMIYGFKGIIGLSNTDEDVVKQKIVNILGIINHKFSRMTPSGQFQGLGLKKFSLEKNKLYVDIALSISSVIMYINLVVSSY